MNPEERESIEALLRDIPKSEWDNFLTSGDGARLQQKLSAVRSALQLSGYAPSGAQPRPIAEVIDLFGHRLLPDSTLGPWLREQLLRTLAPTKWQKLADLYRDLAGKSASSLHGNATQLGAGSRIMAEYWHQGSRWARSFCEIVGLPETLAQTRPNPLPEDQIVEPAEPLRPLHDFQLAVYSSLCKILKDGRGESAMLSLPTGAGKTRVTVEAICDHLAQPKLSKKRNLVLWIAQSDELQQQAWECFRQVWQVPPQKENGKTIHRSALLRICRLWGGRDPDEIEFSDAPTILIAGIDQLASWAKNKPDFFERLPNSRLACVVIDEAHTLITKEQRDVLLALKIKAKHEWRTLQNAPLVIGLSATPWRTDDEETKTLKKFFQKRLLKPEALGNKPISALQKKGILSKVKAEQLDIVSTPPMSYSQKQRFDTFREIPPDYLELLGFEDSRNARIIERLGKLSKECKTLVFACSIAHAELLTMALNRALGDDCAALVTGLTPRAERAELIERFREDGDLRFLCNVSVLTTGFDAPKADVVCITRPTTSAILYEQMVGRGLRGLKNGGTKECLVLDVQDGGLPDGIQSYARVLRLWDGS
jgi:DNA repair protein RadD